MHAFSNSEVFVSSEMGEDVSGCGASSNSSACKTVAYACGQGLVPRDVIISAGKYAEKEEVTVEGGLIITGIYVLCVFFHIHTSVLCFILFFY
jgi:hypothetical protein